jgi:peptidoglycan hydrolase-like protein with peptidoglycan-binding domain
MDYVLDKAGGSASKPPAGSGGSAPPLSVDYFGPAYGHNYTCGDVRTWQQQMQARGWTVGVDGKYGPQSEGVCEQFQAEKGLKVDGLVGPATWGAAWTAPLT